jgi:hypothetical protein
MADQRLLSTSSQALPPLQPMTDPPIR